MGVNISTLLSRFLGIRSADPIKTVLFFDGILDSFAKQKILACSKYRPMILLTTIFSESFLTPGLKQQIPLMNNSIFTPAAEAS